MNLLVYWVGVLLSTVFCSAIVYAVISENKKLMSSTHRRELRDILSSSEGRAAFLTVGVVFSLSSWVFISFVMAMKVLKIISKEK